jgi:hypothetical protein
MFQCDDYDWRVTMLEAIREVQVPLLAAMLLSACIGKATHLARDGAAAERFGPTVLFPMVLQVPLALALCAAELILGFGLIVTAGRFGLSAATPIRIATCLLFVISSCALLELRATRPSVGCGCFGDLSRTPVSIRTLARSSLLAVAALATIHMKSISLPTAGEALKLIAILCLELVVIGALSPEVGEGLIRLGYSEPCELRDIPAARTLALLRRSKQWRRYRGLITADKPSDIWRELCWRYVVYPSDYAGRPADIVFAVYLQQRRPIVHATLVDANTGLALPWQAPQTGVGRQAAGTARRLTLRLTPSGGLAAATAPAARDIPFSSDVYTET